MRLVIEVASIAADALGAALCVVVLAVRLPPSRPVFEPGLRPHATTVVWPAQLVRLERIIAWSAANGRDAHTGPRPVLVEIAETRLARRGLRLDRDAAEAQRLPAGLDGRDFVTPDDIKLVAVPALAHRITLRPELWIQRVDAEDVVRECLAGCPVPAVRAGEHA